MKVVPSSFLALPLMMLAFSCASADPESDLLKRPTGTSGTTTGTTSSGSDSGTAPGADGSTPGPSPTTPPGSDGGPTPTPDASTPPPVNAFTGAPAYVATTGRNARKNAHGNGGNPAKLACLSCHRAGGNAPTWFAGGTVFTSAAGTTPAPQVEVRFRDATGKAASTYSDADGNFYLTPGQANGLAFPLQVAARDATTVRPMVTMLANGDCSAAACHGGATVGAVHVP